MTAPNLVSPTTITGKTARVSITTTSSVTILTNSSSSNKVLKINTIFAANVDGNQSANITLFVNDGSTDVHIAKTILVPPSSTQVICQKDTYFYMEEGHTMKATASAANDIDLIVGYEEIS